ncbi:DNA-binding protein [Romboutsia sedimentorum]|uniref:DNA-binding protein n=1 Tax=Romboutsia sedimentorum TaxID=1368474 RepID=A0ABT7E939_9FIRM|nr:DNA-binding protein [Romboutsia sedimentorum]MDK2563444.1 DNA-binding protein [Romboutsia sedimentorum]MDK2585167.1 DNA-binding protein [Romboutsia sedimentorum]
MKGKERIEKFLELQEKNIEFEDISKEIGIASKTLRSFLNRNGYKLENNKYKIKESNEIKQIEFKNIKEQKKESKNGNTKNTKEKNKIKSQKNNNPKLEISIKEKNKKKLTPKKDKKINMTVEDMDKLCEVYDWYMQVKDYKSMKPKKISSKKDINIENKDMTNLKNTSIRVDKTTWENFERLCSNSQFSKQEILTQALRDFMNEHKYLL